MEKSGTRSSVQNLSTSSLVLGPLLSRGLPSSAHPTGFTVLCQRTGMSRACFCGHWTTLVWIWVCVCAAGKSNLVIAPWQRQTDFFLFTICWFFIQYTIPFILTRFPGSLKEKKKNPSPYLTVSIRFFSVEPSYFSLQTHLES